MSNTKIILEKMLELKKLCYENKIPMFVTAAIGENGDETQYESEMVSPVDIGVELSQDKIALMVNVLRGFQVIPPIPMEDIEICTSM